MAVRRSRRLLRATLACSFVLFGAAAALHAANYLQLGADVFAHSSRELIDRSRRLLEVAGPDYQAQVLGELPPNPNNGPFYRFDDRLVEAIVRESPPERGSEEASGVLFGFEFDDPAEVGLESAQSQMTTALRDGLLEVGYEGRDYLATTRPLGLRRADIADIVVRARVQSGTQMRIGWPAEARPDKLFNYNVTVDLVPDGEFHTYVVTASNALKQDLESGELLDHLLLRPSNVDGDTVEIDYVRFISKLAKYQQDPRGVGYETVGAEMRRVLHMVPPHALEFSVLVPERSPALDFGVGVLRDAAPVGFEVSVGSGAEPETVYARSVESPAAWTDARIDLSPWAGRQVRITLSARGSSANVALWSSPVVYSRPRERMNVVLILEDTLRADHLSLHGYERPTARLKERLAETGVLFERAVSQATQTRPSVPSLMTSLLPTATGVWHFSDALRDEYVTLAEVLRAQGFVTASFLQNGNAGPYVGLHQGFDAVLDEELIGKSTQGILGDRLTAWLDRNGGRNFFLNLHIVDPHGPFDPPAPYDRWYRELGEGGTPVRRMEELDPEWLERPTAEARHTLYDGEIANNDALIDGFIAKLDELGLRDDTLVVFLSDHGEFLGEHGLWGHHPPGYLQVTHVPLMLLYPARFSGGRRIEQTAQMMDIMPTVLELARVARGRLSMQGDSLVDLIEGRNLAYWDDRIAVSEEPTRMLVPGEPCGCGSLFFRDWHLISSSSFRPRKAPIPQALRLRVFDLEDDPHETRLVNTFLPDLYQKYRFSRVVRELQANNIEAWRKWTGGSSETVQSDPIVRERLRALGYLQ